LEEDEDDKDEEEEGGEVAGPSPSFTPDASLPVSESVEQTPLLKQTSPYRSRSRSRRSRRMSIGPHGDATVTQAVLMVGSAYSIIYETYLFHLVISCSNRSSVQASYFWGKREAMFYSVCEFF